MKLLLDTHLLLWAAAQPEKLSDEFRRLLNRLMLNMLRCLLDLSRQLGF